MAAAALGIAGCGDSGPEGPNAGFVESMEKLGVSREQAEREAREIDRQVARESRRQEARFQRELTQEERDRAREDSEPAQERSTDLGGGFTGKYATRYEEDRIVCGLVPHSQIAREFGIASTSSPFEVAEAYAEGFYGRFEQAAFEGCLAGIQDRIEN